MRSVFKITMTIAGAIGLWQLVCYLFSVPKYILPKPADVLGAFWDLKSVLLIDTLVTAAQAVGGFVLAGIISVAFGVAATFLPLIKNTVLSAAIIIKSVPIIIFAPLFLIWFGYGVLGKMFLAGIVTVLPLLISLIQGLSATTRAEQDLFTMYGASRMETLTKLLFPKSVPYVMSGLRISAPMAILGSLIAETAGAQYGLGMTMMIASANQNTQLVFAAAILSAAMGLGAFSLVVLSEKLAKKYIDQ
jgi:ABC-type nitrate/sulfonate/bicarbonate transport system permease component